MALLQVGDLRDAGIAAALRLPPRAAPCDARTGESAATQAAAGSESALVGKPLDVMGTLASGLHSSPLAQPLWAQHDMTRVLGVLRSMCVLLAMWQCGAGWFTQEAWQLIYARACARFWDLVEHGPQPEAPMCAAPASAAGRGHPAVALSESLLRFSACQCIAVAGHQRPGMSALMSPGWGREDGAAAGHAEGATDMDVDGAAPRAAAAPEDAVAELQVAPARPAQDSHPADDPVSLLAFQAILQQIYLA